MKTPAFVIFCLLLSFFLLLLSPFTQLILDNPESYQPTKQLIKHFAGLNEIPSVFGEQETSHLEDVTMLVRILFSLLIITATYLVYNKKWIQAARKGTMTISMITLISFILPFEKIFEYFHKILFPQGNYTFLPDSTLIQYYPQTFFQNYAIAIMIGAVIISVIIYLISKLSLKKGTKKHQSRKI